MEHLLDQLKVASLNVVAGTISSKQEQSVLDALNEGVFVVAIDLLQADESPVFSIRYANEALARYFDTTRAALTGKPIEELVSTGQFQPLFQALRDVRAKRTSQSVNITTDHGEAKKHFRVALTHHDAAGSEPRIIGTVSDISALTLRTQYLEERASNLIEHAHKLETSRRDLEQEVQRLRGKVDHLSRAAQFDPDSGLPTRAHFLERASAEFQRSRRYDHPLATVVVNVQGYQNIADSHGAHSKKLIMTGMGQVCDAAYRAGIDIAGRTGEAEIAILLPETGLTGGLQFIDRLRTLVSNTPLQIDEGHVRLGLQTGVDALQDEDLGYLPQLNRARAAFAG